MPRSAKRSTAWLGVSLCALLSILVSQTVISRIGVELFVIALGGILVAFLFALASFRNTLVPFIIWIVAVCGFRFLWSVRSPILPDLYLDRMMLIWLGVIFMVKSVAQRRALRGPYLPDILILAHGVYIYVRVYIQDSQFLQPWFMSVAIPYFAYFLGKNIVDDNKKIRILWWALIGLTFYYSFTAIAEKYHAYSPGLSEVHSRVKGTRVPGPVDRALSKQAAVFGTVFAIPDSTPLVLHCHGQGSCGAPTAG